MLWNKGIWYVNRERASKQIEALFLFLVIQQISFSIYKIAAQGFFFIGFAEK